MSGLADGYAQALVINSKNANVATGQRGVEIAREITGMVAAELGIAPEDVIPSSTIGQQLPLETFRQAIPGRLRRNCVRTSSDWQRRRS